MGSDQKPAALVWDEAVAAAAKTLAEAKEYGGAYGQQERRPSNFGRAADYLKQVPNPYRGGGAVAAVSPHASEEWFELCRATEALATAAQWFDTARAAYTTKYPITNR